MSVHELAFTHDMKEMEVSDLLKMMKALQSAMRLATVELESKMKRATHSTRSMRSPNREKGSTPMHLKKNNAWVAYVKEHTRLHGWEEFTIIKKDGELTMDASVVEDGVHVNPITHKGMHQNVVMSYAKWLWSTKTATGAHKEIYEAFEAQYCEASEEEPIAAAVSAASAASADSAVPVASVPVASVPVVAKKIIRKKHDAVAGSQ